MLWLKAFHIIFMVTWFAGLFYLPRLFVYHAMTEDAAVRAAYKTMQRRLLVMMHIGGVLACLFGVLLLWQMPGLLGSLWMQLKLLLVISLVVFHWRCAKLVQAFARDEIKHSHQWFRWFNEFPTLVLMATVLLVVLKPF
ncbi:MAG TPA: CopD family protein [Xanthomonadales bacterium]|nr:CopD family protein [Xanthomonadales bacterium]